MRPIIENIVKPALTRTGTMVSGMLVGYGIQADHANNIAIGLVALVLVGVDFAASYLNRRTIAKKAALYGE